MTPNTAAARQLNPARAAAELLERRQARRSLIAFTEYTKDDYETEPVHELVGGHLDHVVEGDVERLMILMPPQTGKSELVSRRLPAYWFGRHPDQPVILTSYGASLAHRMSGDARSIVESFDYSRLFPGVRTQGDSRAKDHWKIAGHDGSLTAAGVGGPITGQGALLAIIDDPFKSWEEAQSKVVRDKVDNWYRGTFRQRLWENARVVLLMTRWHEDDLAGRLLKRERDRWTVVRLPAAAESDEEREIANRVTNLTMTADPLGREPGEPLAPGRFSREEMAETKEEVGSVVWNGVYQQRPTAPEGNRFKRTWFEQTVSNYPKQRLVLVRYWDTAGTEGGGAYTVGVLLGHDRQEGLTYVLDVQRGQWAEAERDAEIKATAERDDAAFGGRVTTWIEQQPGSSGKEVAQDQIKKLAGYSVHADRPTGDKDVRLEPFAAQAEAGNVRLLEGDWNEPYIDEMVAIPNGNYRDQGDATAGAYAKAAIGGKKTARARSRG